MCVNVFLQCRNVSAYAPFPTLYNIGLHVQQGTDMAWRVGGLG